MPGLGLQRRLAAAAVVVVEKQAKEPRSNAEPSYENFTSVE
jgi:hypothetical protein